MASVPLPGSATGSPMTYVVDGTQYIAVPIGGSGLPAELVALRLRQ
jgi:quinoprotein glucose dehydrogenase